ncbi:hypothetical protein V5O48_008333 [Marasmius crinis-equi]|uniref:FAD-binding PCMH-type domain-containing protein n=1 Tax=Marasmius crinis-equi TaxID=585013 RepID=A0ABR3FEE5_9AGAR
MAEQQLENLGFTGKIVTPKSPDYDPVNKRYPHNSILRPLYILLPRDIQDISKAIHFARSQNPHLEIAVKGGGAFHYPSASSNGGLVIDLSMINRVVVSDDKQSVSVGGGALWSDVYSETDKHGVVPVGGSVHFLGVGGFTLGGGYAHSSGRYGLGVDNIVKTSVVLADGKIVETSEESEPDLFWAIRGCVGQFGIVAELVLKTYPLPGPMTVGAMIYPGTELQNILAALRPGLLVLPYIENSRTPPDNVLAPFRELAKPIVQNLETVDTFTAVSHASDRALQGVPPRLLSNGALVSDAWDDTITITFKEWLKFTEQPEFKTTTCMWQFGHREKIAGRKAEDMAFSERRPHYYLNVLPRYVEASDDAKAAEWALKVIALVRRAQVEKTGTVLNTPITFALSPETVSVEEIFGENLPKLRQIKAKYDPEKVWNRGWVIEPGFSSKTQNYSMPSDQKYGDELVDELDTEEEEELRYPRCSMATAAGSLLEDINIQRSSMSADDVSEDKARNRILQAIIQVGADVFRPSPKGLRGEFSKKWMTTYGKIKLAISEQNRLCERCRRKGYASCGFDTQTIYKSLTCPNCVKVHASCSKMVQASISFVAEKISRIHQCNVTPDTVAQVAIRYGYLVNSDIGLVLTSKAQRNVKPRKPNKEEQMADCDQDMSPNPRGAGNQRSPEEHSRNRVAVRDPRADSVSLEACEKDTARLPSEESEPTSTESDIFQSAPTSPTRAALQRHLARVIEERDEALSAGMRAWRVNAFQFLRPYQKMIEGMEATLLQRADRSEFETVDQAIYSSLQDFRDLRDTVNGSIVACNSVASRDELYADGELFAGYGGRRGISTAAAIETPAKINPMYFGD